MASSTSIGSGRPQRQPIWALAATLALTGMALLRGGAKARGRHASGAGASATGKDESRLGPPDATAPSAREEAPPAVSHGRAQQDGRGRNADAPQQIPWRGWKDVLWRTYEEATEDRLLAVAAGVVFYALLAVFPAITALVSSYGLFADPRAIGDHLSVAAGVMPGAAFDLLRGEVVRIAGKGGGTLTFGFVAGLAVALWSANAGVKAMFDALNVIYDEEEKRGFFRLNAVSLTFTLGAVAMGLLALGAVVVFPVILGALGLASFGTLLFSLLRWPVLFALIVVGLAVLYRYGPSRQKAEWRWLSPGSVVAALAWIAGSLGFSYYLQNFADYSATYGSLGAVIGLMMWMWLSAIVVLVGAELNAEAEHQTARDSTEGGDKPLGARGAAMADTVGKAHDEGNGEVRHA